MVVLYTFEGNVTEHQSITRVRLFFLFFFLFSRVHRAIYFMLRHLCAVTIPGDVMTL